MQTPMNTGADNAGTSVDVMAATTAKAHAATAALNQDLLAGLAKIREGEPKEDADAEPKVESGAEPKAAAEGKPEPVVEAKPLDEVPLDEVPLDDKAKARLVAEQARAQRHKDQVAKDRGELDAMKARLEAEWKPQIEKAEQFLGLKGGGVPAALRALELLELSEDDYAALAPAAWALSPKGKADPKAKAAAAGTLKDHGMESRFAKLEADNKALRDQITARETAAKHEADRDRYLVGVQAALDTATDAPLVKKLAAKSPGKAKELMLAAAVELLDEDGVIPAAPAVLARAEQRRRAFLADEGIEPDALIAPAKPAAAAPKTPAKTLANEGGTGASPPPRPSKTGRELDAEIIAGLRNLRKSGSVT